MTNEALSADEALGMAWWNNLSEDQRAYWMREAKTGIVAEAWAYFKTKVPGAASPDEDADLRMADSDFWFSPLSIPQYDYLVEQGRVTVEEAQELRKQREQMGLPMTFADLQPKPSPEFEWVYRFGGPSLQQYGDYDRTEIQGREWSLDCFGSSLGKLSSHDALGQDGYLQRQIRLRTCLRSSE